MQVILEFLFYFVCEVLLFLLGEIGLKVLTLGKHTIRWDLIGQNLGLRYLSSILLGLALWSGLAALIYLWVT